MDNSDKSCEPMDVDISGSSIGMDISYPELDTGYLSLIKSENNKTLKLDTGYLSLIKSKNNNETLNFHCNSVSLDSNIDQPGFIKVYHINKKTEKRASSITLILPIIIVTCISIFVYQVLNVECNSELNKDSIKDKLYRKLYGQNSAVNNIISTLDKDAESKILFFYGGTGVGKTYTVSLLLEDTWDYSNVYHYTMPVFMETFSTEMMLGLTICKTAIFIIDDLAVYDVDSVKSHVNKILIKSVGLEKKVTIILVFNCDSAAKEFVSTCNDSFEATVLNTFADVNAFKQFIKFEPLTTEHLKMCIEDEMSDKKIDDHVLKHILKNFNVSVDGCKGVHQKIKSLNSA